MVRLEDFKESGFYLIFPDDTKLFLTRESILAFGCDFLGDPANVPPEVKKAVDFQACSICPKRDSGEFCHALLPTLPFIHRIDRYVSHDPVTAIYRDSEKNFTAVQGSTMQRALQHLSIMSLIHYCEVGKQYRDFFVGVTPLMEFEEAVNRIYLNVFWLNGGDKSRIRKALQEFSAELTITANCQVNRLRLICRNDAFINAFCITHLITHFLSGDMELCLHKSLESFRKQSATLCGDGPYPMVD